MNKELLEKIITKKGKIKQSFVAVEELAELQQAVSKAVRFDCGDKFVPLEIKRNITEEIADVMICIEQIKMMYGISDDDIEAWIECKLERLEDRYL